MTEAETEKILRQLSENRPDLLELALQINGESRAVPPAAKRYAAHQSAVGVMGLDGMMLTLDEQAMIWLMDELNWNVSQMVRFLKAKGGENSGV